MRSSARQLDQFYTKSAVAKSCVGWALACLKSKGVAAKNIVWVEPSAGAGAFLNYLPSSFVALDLAPARPDITQADYLLWSPPASKKDQSIVVVGNPPFGKNSSLAVKFFNKSATYADAIAFIVPRTFEKLSVQKRLSDQFELAAEHPIAANSFEFEGEDVEVPCVFQVWVRLKGGAVRHTPKKPTFHGDFERVKDRSQADFAMQRVGVAAGKIKDINSVIASASHHFIRVVDRKKIKIVRQKFEGLDFSSVKHKTAGNPSISLTELVEIYSQS